AGIELKLGLFFRGNADADVETAVNSLVQQVDLLVIIDNGNTFFMPAVHQAGDIPDVLVPLEPVAQHIVIRSEFSLLQQVVDDIDIESRRGLYMNVIFESFLENMLEMRTLRTVTIVVFAV